MKFMKLGAKSDTFISVDDSTRSVSSGIPTDIAIVVDTTRFLLHKFPLLSKCSRLKKLRSKSSSAPEQIELPGFPGGVAAFELCAKFCYGVTITVSAANIVAAISAAACLGMTEEQEHGNLLGKLESFLSSCLLRRWKDALTVLRQLPAYSAAPPEPDSTAESVLCKVCHQCITALVGMIADEPSRGWAADVAELETWQFTSIMAAVKATRRVPGELVGEALQLHLRRRPPEVELLREVASLLPEEKGSLRFGFLMRMVEAARLVGLEERGEVVRRAAEEMEGAEVREVVGDVATVVEVVREFMRRNCDEVEAEEKVVKVGRVVDGWLKVKADTMEVDEVVEIAAMVPEWARKEHDELYRAVDLYLKAHPDLDKSERKRLCRIIDCKRLSSEACTHSAQNDRLPLRVVVQSLFFEHARATASGTQVAELPPGIKVLLTGTIPSLELENGRVEEEWSVSSMKCGNPSLATLRMKLAEDHDNDDDGDDDVRKNGLTRSSSSRFKAMCAIPDKPKRMLSRLLSMNRSISERH